jgi:hypothetical protein
VLPDCMLGGRWHSGIVMTCYIAIQVGKHAPRPEHIGCPLFQNGRDGITRVHSFLRAQTHVDVAAGRQVYYMLTPAHFAFTQLQTLDVEDDVFSMEEQFLVVPSGC